MKKLGVSADRLIAEMNAAYEKQEGYDAANRFRAFPDGAAGKNIRGYTTEGVWTRAHARAYSIVHDVFELDIGE